jgi:hypothetical protein
MTKKTVNIAFFIMGLLIIFISINNFTLIPLIIGFIVLIQGLYGFFKG